jgi:hypothetical protein
MIQIGHRALTSDKKREWRLADAGGLASADRFGRTEILKIDGATESTETF